MRGNYGYGYKGITPACAGRRWESGYNPWRWGDHPRVCGEKCFGNDLIKGVKGSPPRVRGEVLLTALMPANRRITPACAGRRCFHVDVDNFIEDHPRVCGEKYRQRRPEGAEGGSPPRVRGEVVRHNVGIPERRITPACAGRSAQLAFWIYHSQDHPRVCGEKPYKLCDQRNSGGSPPRVRGEENAEKT